MQHLLMKKLSAVLLIAVAALATVQAARLCHTQIVRNMGFPRLDHDFVKVSETTHDHSASFGFGSASDEEAGSSLMTHVAGSVAEEHSCCTRWSFFPIDEGCARAAATSLAESPYDDMRYPASINIVKAIFGSSLNKVRGDTSVCWDYARDWKAFVTQGNAKDIENGPQKFKACVALRRRSRTTRSGSLVGPCARPGVFSDDRCMDCSKGRSGCKLDKYTGLYYDPECKVVDSTSDKGMTCLELHSAPAGWTCDFSQYDELVKPTCHCGCGIRDPDCDKPDHNNNCEDGEACGPENTCVELLDDAEALDCERGSGCTDAAREGQNWSCEEIWTTEHPEKAGDPSRGLAAGISRSISESVSKSSSSHFRRHHRRQHE